jgi:NAD(P)-dependent dehydrogenase (short-subunit alcohol dehydrogenase family)
MLVNMTEAEWDAVIKVHLKGTFAPSHHAAVYWRELNKATGTPVNARLINTSSVSGIYGNPGQTNYGAAKMGIGAFTIIAARELRRYGVTVNAIAPGALTRLTEDLGGPITEERRRSGDPRWVAPIAVWLASEESAEVSGRMFESSGNVFAIAESWHRGPTHAPVDDPTVLGPIVAEMVAKARKNAGMNGMDLD